MEKKQILIIMNSLYNGGAEKSLVNLLNEIDYDKYSVDLLLFKREGIFIKELPIQVNLLETPINISILLGSNIKKHYIVKIKRILYTLLSYMLTKNPRQRKQIRWKLGYKKLFPKIEKKYDIAIAYVNGEPTYYLVDKVKASKKIAWVHNDYSAFNFNEKAKMFDREYFLNLDKVVTISDICVKSLREAHRDLEDKFVMLPNITSGNVIRKKADEFKPKEFSKTKINILSIGRLSYQKGFDLAIEAASILKNELNIDFQWFIIGDGEERKRLDKISNKLGTVSLINFIGVRENPYPYIKNCNILVQTSRYEGKSMVIDEAKIIGKPIVITNYATAKNQIKNDEEGIIVEVDSKSIALGIERVLKDNELRIKLENTLKNNKYCNEDDIKKYYSLFEGEK